MLTGVWWVSLLELAVPHNCELGYLSLAYLPPVYLLWGAVYSGLWSISNWIAIDF